MNVYFVRHGESFANSTRTWLAGDVALTEKGVRQARFTAERFTKIEIDLIVSSTLKRAKDTAAIIGERIGRSVECADLFVERREPSVFVGKNIGDYFVREVNREIFAHAGDPSWRHSDEENFFDLRARGERALAYLEELPYENVLVVSHGAFIRLLFLLVVLRESLAHEQFFSAQSGLRSTNTGISLFSFEKGSGWQVWTWQDHAHLG